MKELSVAAREAGEAFAELVYMVETLRDPGGCPWDAKQSRRSLRSLFLEEAYEALEAMDNDDAEALEGELGDILTHVTFQADFARRKDEFDCTSIVRRNIEKLRRRHPHVFPSQDALTSEGPEEKPGPLDGVSNNVEDVEKSWELIKRKESGRTSILKDLPAGLPGLAVAAILLKRAEKAGVTFESRYDPLQSKTSTDSTENEAEVQAGELLMQTTYNVLKTGVNPEDALRTATARFSRKILSMEQHAGGRPLDELLPDETAQLWELAQKTRTADRNEPA